MDEPSKNTPQENQQLIVDTVKNLLVNSSQVYTATVESNKAAEGILKDVSTLQTQNAQDATVISATAGLAALNSQEATLRAANAAGVNPLAGMDELSKLMTLRREKAAETRNHLSEYRKLNETSFWNSPGDWIAAQFEKIPTAKKLEGAAKETAVITQQLSETNQLVQSAAQTYKTLAPSLSAASVESTARLTGNAYLLKAKEAQLEGMKYNLAGVQAAMNTSREQLNILYGVQNHKEGEIRLQATLDSLNDQKLNRSFNQRMKEEKEAADRDKVDFDEALLEKINTGRSILGHSAITGREAKYQLERFKAGGSAELQMAYEIGDKSKTLGIPMLGATPAEAEAALAAANTEVLNSKADVLDIFRQAHEALNQNPMLDRKDKAGTARAFNSAVKTLVTQQFSSVAPNSGNIFDIGDLKSFLGDGTAENPGISDLMRLPIAQKILLPAIQANQPLNDPKIVLGLATDAVKKGTITTTEFYGLADIYRKGNLLNQQHKNLLGMGIVLPKNGMGYNVRTGAGQPTLDLTDPTMLGQYLSRVLAYDAYANQGVGNLILDTIRNPLKGNQLTQESRKPYTPGPGSLK
jgi:hypothetical protein